MDKTNSYHAVPQPPKPLPVDWLKPNQALDLIMQKGGQWCWLIPVSPSGHRYSNVYAKRVCFLDGVFYFKLDEGAKPHPARTDLLTRDYNRWHVEVIADAYLEG